VGSSRDTEFQSEERYLNIYPRAVSTPLDLSPATGGKPEGGARASATVALRLRGAESVRFFPAARETSVKLAGDWKNPSFAGYALPSARQVGGQGFTVEWFATESSRPFANSLEANLSDDEKARFRGYSFGVDFLLPNDVYSLCQRSLRYALIFIIIPFAALFLFELTRKKRVHPVQYAFIGLADAVFYLLTLSASEQIDFLLAYALAAAAVTALIGMYATSLFKSRKQGLAMAGILGAQYLYLFFALKSEDNALLIGSVGLFALIAILMFTTRKIDWYREDKPTDEEGKALGKEGKPTAGGQAAGEKRPATNGHQATDEVRD
jgi:inner membrane protein